MTSKALWLGVCGILTATGALANEEGLPFVAEVALLRVQGDVGPLLASILSPEHQSIIDAISSNSSAEGSNVKLCGIVSDADSLQAGLAAAASGASDNIVDITGGAPVAVPLGLGRDAAAALEIRDGQPVYYFAPAKEQPGPADSGTLFELRKWEQPLGLKLTLEIGSLDVKDPKNPVALLRTWILPEVVAARKPVEGTSLEAGEPVMGTVVWYNVALRATLGKWTAVVLGEPSPPSSPRKTLFLMIKLSSLLPALDLAKIAGSPSVDEPQYSNEFRIIHVKHDLGEKALHGLSTLPEAQRISGDAVAFSVSFDVERIDDLLLLPDGTIRALRSGKRVPRDARRLSAELLSAPRVTVSTLRDPAKYKTLMRDGPGAMQEPVAPEKANGNAPSERSSLFFDPAQSQQFLFRDLVSFLQRDLSREDRNRKPLAPALISDAYEQDVPYFEHEQGTIYRLHSNTRERFGFLCGIVLTELENGEALEADVLFRNNTLVKRERIEGTNLPAGPPVFDQVEFRYVVRVKPNEWIGFAYPQKDGHTLVLLRVQKVSGSGDSGAP
jgi:hypothetical protein